MKTKISVMLMMIFCFMASLMPGLYPLSTVTAELEPATILTNEIDVGDNPIRIDYNWYTNHTFVVNQGSNNVSVIDARTYKTLATVPVGNNPFSLRVNVDTDKIYVSNTSDNSVSVIDGKTNTVKTTISVGTSPGLLAVNRFWNKIYVVNQSSNNVSVIDGVTDTVTATISVGSAPFGIAINQLRDRVFVTNTASNNMSIINGRINKVERTVETGQYPRLIGYHYISRNVYIENVNSDFITVYDCETGETSQIQSGLGSKWLAGNRITGKLYQIIGENVLAIDAKTGQLEATIVVGKNPVCLGVNHFTQRVYAVNNGSNNVSAIDGATNTVIKTYGVGQGPTFIRVALKNNKLWVANSAGDSVTCIVDNGKLRMWGVDRFKTAASISEYGWETSDYVVLSKGSDFPDALAAAPLACEYNAPLLLTRTGFLPPATKEEIIRLEAKEVYILGQQDAISQNVVDQIVSECGISSDKIHRLGGDTRIETAIQVANELKPLTNTTAFIATAWNFPDSLSAAPIAGAEKFPILLTRTGYLPDNVKQALKDLGITKTLVVGGPDVVAENVFNWLQSNGYNPERLYGDTRYDTCKATVDYALAQGWITMESVGVGFGENFPDALALGPFMGMSRGPVLLCRETYLPEAINELLTAHKAEIHAVYIAGGTDVISEAVDESITNIVGF